MKSFIDLINIAEKNRELELKYDLERNVKLVNFEDGKIEDEIILSKRRNLSISSSFFSE